MESKKRPIDANALREEISSLTMVITGLRCGKGVLREYEKEYKKSVLKVVDEAPTVDAVEVKCKVGGLVYALWEAPVKQKYIIYCAEVKEIRIGMRNCRLTTTYRLEPIMYRGHIHEYRDEDFGKLVFPSENEAEAALAKMDGEEMEG